MSAYKYLRPGEPCAECERMPVNSRRNTTCLSCGAAVCIRCQEFHFVERHES